MEKDGKETKKWILTNRNGLIQESALMIWDYVQVPKAQES